MTKPGRSSALIFSVLWLLLVSSGCQASEITVGLNDDLGEAVATAPPGSTIRLSGGHFPRACNIEVKTDLHIVGSSAAGTHLSCDSSRIFNIIQATLTLSDLSLSSSNHSQGGCLHAENSSISLKQVSFTSCAATEAGGAIYVKNSTIAASACNFTRSTSDLGGAIFMHSSKADISEARFDENSAGQGGALFAISFCSVQIHSNVAFESNSALGAEFGDPEAGGGAIAIQDNVDLQVSHSVHFKSNYAGNGGAIFSKLSNTISVQAHVLFQSNYHDWYGAGIMARYGGSVNIGDGVKFDSNLGGWSGGGIEVWNNVLLYVGEGTVFENNEVTWRGAAISSEFGASVYVQGAVIDNNVAFWPSDRTQGGGIALAEGGDLVIGTGTLIRNNYASMAGGIYTWNAGGVHITDRTHLILNQAEFGGGALFAGAQSVSISDNVKFEDCHAYTSGGALLLDSNWDTVIMSNVEFVRNSAGSDTGVGAAGAILSDSSWGDRVTLHSGVYLTDNSAPTGAAIQVQGGSVLDIYDDVHLAINHAEIRGGAIAALEQSRVLMEGVVSVRDCSAPLGGALFLSDQATFSGYLLCSGNNASTGGCLFSEGDSSTVLMSGANFYGNRASNGGAVYLSGVSSLNTSGQIALSLNSAELEGGAVYVSSKTSAYVNDVKFEENQAGHAGGSMSVWGSATVHNCSFHGDSAVLGGSFSSFGVAEVLFSDSQFSGSKATQDGGCGIAEGTSFTRLVRSTVGPGCSAGSRGGGLAVRDKARFLVQEGVMVHRCSSMDLGGGLFHAGESVSIGEDVTFADNHCKGSGAGIAALSLLHLHSKCNVERNTCDRDGAGILVSGSDAKLLIDPEAELIVDSNVAGADGGGIALLGGKLEFVQELCPAECLMWMRGDGQCHFECMTASCGWDGGDCNTRFTEAASEAAYECDRDFDVCPLVKERDSAACWNECLRPSCDFSEGSPACSPRVEQLAQCPLFDAILFQSLTQEFAPIFVEGGSVSGYGRCNSSNCQPHPVNVTESWCETLDDAGIILEREGPDSLFFKNAGQAWGFCRPGHPRLFSHGFDYSPAEMDAIVAMSTQDLFVRYPGCGRKPLVVKSNIANHNGGGIFLGECDSTLLERQLCPLGGISLNQHHSMSVLVSANVAGRSGGGLYSKCNDLSACQRLIDQADLLPTLQSSSSMRTLDLSLGNEAGTYGDEKATKASKLVVVDAQSTYIPGQSILNLSFALHDYFEQAIYGSGDIVTLNVCPASSPDCSQGLQQEVHFTIASDKPLTSSVISGYLLESCIVDEQGLNLRLSLVQGNSASDDKLSASVGIKCLPCAQSQSLHHFASKGQHLRTCLECQESEYVIDPSDSNHKCEACPSGAVCSDGTCALSRESMTCPSSQSALVGNWKAQMDGTYSLLDCPRGYLLVNSPRASQRCTPCSPLTYSVNPKDGCSNADDCPGRSCQSCPAGASCPGYDDFSPAVQGSSWTLEEESGTTSYRLIGCPPGYIVVRQEQKLVDQCVACPSGKFSLKAAVFPDILSTNNPSNLSNHCQDCPIGAFCPGGSSVIPDEGYWKSATEDGRRQEQSTSMKIYKCQKGACQQGGNCTEGRTGPACSLCAQEYALAGGECKLCTPTDHQNFYIVLWAVGIPLLLLLWYYVSWRPLFLPVEEEDQDFQRAASGGSSTAPHGFQVASLLKIGFRIALTSNILDYIKIMISFLQVVSSFGQTFDLRWPTEFENFWAVGTFLRLDVFNIGGSHCIASTWGYYDRLQVTTIVPVLILALIWTPSLYLWLSNEKSSKHFKPVYHRAWFATMFSLFIVYPIVSITTMQGLSCRQIEGRNFIISAPESTCPAEEKGSVFAWVLLSVFIYPIGVLVFMYCVLVMSHVPQIAEKKIEDATFQELVKMFLLYSGDTVCGKIASYIGGDAHVTDHALGLVEERARVLYDGVTEYYTRKMTFAGLLAFMKEAECDGEHPETIEQMFEEFDAGRKGFLSLLEFENLIRAVMEKDDVLSGEVTVDSASYEQLLELCKFNWNEVFDDAELSAGGTVLERQLKKKMREDEKLDKTAKLQSQGSMARLQKIANDLTRDCPEFKMTDKTDRPALLAFISDIGARLRRSGIITLPLLPWNSETHEEKEALETCGFLFDTYKVQYWYMELLEMSRKLLLMGVIIFLFPGSSLQLITGLVVCTGYTILYAFTLPFSDAEINSLFLMSLIAQCLALFYGTVKEVVRIDQDTYIGEGSTSDVAVRVIVMTLQILTLLYPFIGSVVPMLRIPNLRKLIFKSKEKLTQTESIKANSLHSRRKKISSLESVRTAVSVSSHKSTRNSVMSLSSTKYLVTPTSMDSGLRYASPHSEAPKTNLASITAASNARLPSFSHLISTTEEEELKDFRAMVAGGGHVDKYLQSNRLLSGSPRASLEGTSSDESRVVSVDLALGPTRQNGKSSGPVEIESNGSSLLVGADLLAALQAPAYTLASPQAQSGASAAAPHTKGLQHGVETSQSLLDGTRVAQTPFLHSPGHLTTQMQQWQDPARPLPVQPTPAQPLDLKDQYLSPAGLLAPALAAISSQPTASSPGLGPQDMYYIPEQAPATELWQSGGSADLGTHQYTSGFGGDRVHHIV